MAESKSPHIERVFSRNLSLHYKVNNYPVTKNKPIYQARTGNPCPCATEGTICYGSTTDSRSENTELVTELPQAMSQLHDYEKNHIMKLSQRISACSVNLAKKYESKMTAVHRSLCLMLTIFT